MYIWFRTGDAKALLIFGFLTFDLIVISFIDLKHRIIPDSLSLSAALIGLLASPFNQYLGGNVLTRIFNSGAGLLAGGAVMYLTGMLGEKIFKKEALGGGDIKLMAAAGAFVGWHGIVAALFFGSFLGTLVSLALIYVFKTKKWGEYVPFGPFLASGVLIYVFAFML
jgi:leader peptidase (prepilin peptidase)/N-methyltransferase